MMSRSIQTTVGVFLLQFLSTAGWGAPAAPDWASRMRGEWAGEGARMEIHSGVQTLVEVRVSSEVVAHSTGAALISRNRFKETELNAQGEPVRTKEYDRNYWVREKRRQGSRVDLIFGSGANPSSPGQSEGFFDLSSSLLTVQENVSPAIRVWSQSDLSNDGLTLYLETIWVNGEKKTSTEIRYQRVP